MLGEVVVTFLARAHDSHRRCSNISRTRSIDSIYQGVYSPATLSSIAHEMAFESEAVLLASITVARLDWDPDLAALLPINSRVVDHGHETRSRLLRWTTS